MSDLACDGLQIRNLADHDLKLKSHYEFVYLICAQSDKQFACKCVETAQPIRGQEIREIQYSITKS